MSSWSRMPSTASLSPLTTLSTPSGRPASLNACAIHSAAEGSRSLGLRMTVLPHAIAVVTIHSGTMAGKLNGVMHATMPTGWRTEWTSTPEETCSENSPLRWCMRPAQYSTFSRPRTTSPAASETTLPCSAVMMRASSSLFAVTISRSLNMTAARFVRPVARQAGRAARAASTACSRSLTLASATRPLTSPVAGLNTSCSRPVPATSPPLIQWPICLMSLMVHTFVSWVPRCARGCLRGSGWSVVRAPRRARWWWRVGPAMVPRRAGAGRPWPRDSRGRSVRRRGVRRRGRSPRAGLRRQGRRRR